MQCRGQCTLNTGFLVPGGKFYGYSIAVVNIFISYHNCNNLYKEDGWSVNILKVVRKTLKCKGTWSQCNCISLCLMIQRPWNISSTHSHLMTFSSCLCPTLPFTDTSLPCSSDLIADSNYCPTSTVVSTSFTISTATSTLVVASSASNDSVVTTCDIILYHHDNFK